MASLLGEWIGSARRKAPLLYPVPLPAVSGLVNQRRFGYSLVVEAPITPVNGLSARVAPPNDLSREVTVVNEFGLHARSAAKIARIAMGARSGVWILREEERADASSTLEVLTLACPKGSRLQFRIEDPADHSILDALVRLVERGFDE